MSYRLLFASLLIGFFGLFGALLRAPTAGAWASNDPSPHSRQDYIDFIDARIGSTTWRDATGSNYAIFWNNSYPDDFFLIYGHNNTSVSGAFRLNDYGTFTEVQGYQMCRWSGDLSGGAGCNPGGSAGWPAHNIYYVYANPDWMSDQTNGGAIVGNPGLFAPEGEKVTPTFGVRVEKKHGVIKFRDADETKDYKYAWTLAKFTESELIADAEYVTSGVNDPVSEGAFDVDEYGKYVLGVKMCPVGTDVDDETCSAIAGTGAVWLTLNINGQVIDIDTGDDPDESPSLGNCSTETLGGEEITHCASFQEGLFASCVQETFPFIDFGACTGNIGKLMGLLTFNFFGIGGLFDATPCKQLGTLGTWINRPGETVCPMIPENVRNITTPFVMSALGLMMIAFITRQTRERF